MKHVGVLSNPRSGTSLMVRMLTLGFDLSGTTPLFPVSGEDDIYSYRVGPEDLKRYGNKNCYAILVLRDPRSVITSHHPSHDKPFTFDFGDWYENYMKCVRLRSQVNLREVVYEDLLLQPDLTQDHLSRWLGLPTALRFSECASASPKEGLRRCEEMDAEMGGARPLEPGRAYRWKRPEFTERIEQQLDLYPEMLDILIKLGFEEDATWIYSLRS